MVYSIASTPLAWAFSQISLSLGFGDGGDGEAGEKDWKKANGDWVIWDNLQVRKDSCILIYTFTDQRVLSNTESDRHNPIDSSLITSTIASRIFIFL